MAKKPKQGKLTGRKVTLLRTRPQAVQANDVSREVTLGDGFAKGGSAAVYALDGALADTAVAKIYHEEFRKDTSVDAFSKLVALVVRHDELKARLPFVMWPDELVLERPCMSDEDARKALLGFTMPLLPGGTISLFNFLKQGKYRNKFPVSVHARFAARFAEQVGKLHAAGLVFCDMNPKNIHVSRDLEKIYFLDADGYQLALKSHLVTSRGVTQGYASPSAIANHATNPTAARTPADDAFVLAILMGVLPIMRRSWAETTAGVSWLAWPELRGRQA